MPNLGQIVYLEKSELSKDPIGRELETRQKKNREIILVDNRII